MRSLVIVGMCVVTLVTALGVARAVAQDAAPAATPGPGGAATLILVEHAEAVSTVDLGEPGTTPGDVLVWGPNPLFDAANASDTGATTQGSCLALSTAGFHHCFETIVFPDGGTIEIQGVQPPGDVPSTRTVVGGSGRYRDASGTVSIDPSADLTVWTKTFDLTT